MHKLLQRQLRKAADKGGNTDLEKLIELVSRAYEEVDADRRRTDRSITLMIEEVEQLHRELQGKEEQRFEAAIENMPFGVSVYNAGMRLITTNRLYREMYGLPADLAQPGAALRDLLKYRVDRGYEPVDADADADYVERVVDIGQRAGASDHRLRAPDGRIISVVHRPMPDGGLVSVHRDITEEIRRVDELKARETELRRENLRFDAAVNNMAHGLSMFGPDHKLVVCNQNYIDLYEMPAELCRPGTPFRDVVAYRQASGAVPIDGGITDFVNDAIEATRRGRPHSRTFRLTNGRTVAITQQPMRDGGFVATHRDITEELEHLEMLKEHEVTLERQNARFNTALGALTQGLALFNADQKLLVANRAYAEIYGMPEDMVQPGVSYREILDYRAAHGTYAAEASEEFIERSLKAIAEGKPRTFRVELAGGKIISVTHQPLDDGGFLGAHLDITDEVGHMRALEAREEELRRQNVRFEAAVSSMTAGMALFDSDRRLVIGNDTFARLYNVPPEMLVPGTPFEEILRQRIANGAVTPASPEDYIAEKAKVVDAGKPAQHTVETSDGRTIQVRHNPMPDGGWVAIHEDITEQVRHIEALKAREAALEQQHLRLDAAVNSLSLGFVMFDTDQRLVICNDAYARIYGLPDSLRRPGTPLRAILEDRISQGLFGPDVAEDYIDDLLAIAAASQPTARTHETVSGHIIEAHHHPMADGGWAATHEDVTERVRAAKAVEEAEGRWNFALESAGQGVWDANLTTGEVFYSRQWKLLRGFDLDEEVDGSKESWLARVHPDDRERIRETVDKQDSGEIPRNSFEYRERHRDGHWMWIASRGRPVEWDDTGKPLRIIGTDTDITKRKELELELETNLALLHTTFENYPGGICMYDRDMVLKVANATYFEMLGLDQKRFGTGVRLEDIVRHLAERGRYGEGDIGEIIADRLAFAVEANPAVYERVMPETGRIIEFKRVPLANGGFVQTMEDITEKRHNEERIRYLARHDPLTDLPNRTQFLEELDRAEAGIRRGETHAVILIDLDRFKAINDTLGHSVGDAVLRSVGDKIGSVLREGDIAARLGGDEFAVLARGIDEPAQAANIAARLVGLLNEPIEVDGHQVLMGASIGISVGPLDGKESAVLMKNADLALYRAKSDGRGAYHFFEQGMDEALQRRRGIETALKKALVNEDFRLVYQPILDLDDLSILGFEALLRWRGMDGESIGPAEFIPVAEETGLIIPIGEWVLQQACAEAAGWPEPVGVAVNLSAVQFRARSLIETVTGALEQSGLDPQRLELEITESVLLAETEHTLNTLHRLRELGVRISMDDFGTGYSSLSYFRSFPFDKIKIDRSFISELGKREDNMAIITAVIELSKRLGMSTTAEGIETEEQMRLLRTEGCEQAQGFLFSPPLPAGAVAGLLDGINPGTARPDAEAQKPTGTGD